MTARQRSYFFGELWPAACAKQGWDELSTEAKNEHRHEIVRRIAGCDSMADCTQDQLTAIFNEARLLADPENLKAARAVANPEEARREDEWRRLHYRILSLGSARYIQAIARDKFKENNPARLTIEQLRQLKITLIERKRARNRQGAEMAHA